MDYALFTLFFIVCHMCFQGNMAKAYLEATPSDKWPQICSGLNYCTEKPIDYPTDEDLTTMYLNRDVNVPVPTEISNEIEPNYVDETCRLSQYHLEHIYMIKDDNNQTRYALHIPRIYDNARLVQECRAEQMLEDLTDTVGCRQTYTKTSFYVLSQDKTQLELATIKQGLPTSCDAITIED